MSKKRWNGKKWVVIICILFRWMLYLLLKYELRSNDGTPFWTFCTTWFPEKYVTYLEISFMPHVAMVPPISHSLFVDCTEKNRMRNKIVNIVKYTVLGLFQRHPKQVKYNVYRLETSIRVLVCFVEFRVTDGDAFWKTFRTSNQLLDTNNRSDSNLSHVCARSRPVVGLLT